MVFFSVRKLKPTPRKMRSTIRETSKVKQSRITYFCAVKKT